MSELDARLVINKKLEDSSRVLTGHYKNFKTEQSCDFGYAGYLLLGRKGQNLAELEVKVIPIEMSTLLKNQANG